MKLTKQGVRDLDSIGPRRQTRSCSRYIPPCDHYFLPQEMDPRAAFIYGVRRIRDVCQRCGKARP